MERSTEIILSIIIPVYNTPPELISECINSVKKAAITKNHEIIMVNDGSDDLGTTDFLHKIKSGYSVLNQENKGASAARNLGLQHAKGKYILCLDADDLLLPSVNEYLDYLDKNPDVDVAYGDWQDFGDSDFRYKAGPFSKFRHLYIEIQLHTTSIFRKSILEKVYGFNENFKVSEDWDFWSRVITTGHKIVYLKKPLFLYRKIKNGKSLSQTDKTRNIRNEVLKEGKKQFDAHKEITIQTVNEYVLSGFRKNKVSFFKLLLILYFKPGYNLFKKMRVFKNDIVID